MIKVINNGGRIAKTVLLIGTGTLILDPKSEIRDYTVIEMSNSKMKVGTGSVIGYNSFIQCSGLLLKIGENSLLGPHVSYITTSHLINDIPLKKQPLKRGAIVIGNNVWIGANVTVLLDTMIGDNSVIGANSLVNKSIPENEIWGGVPVKKLKNR